jgi:hypothetical protein
MASTNAPTPLQIDRTVIPSAFRFNEVPESADQRHSLNGIAEPAAGEDVTFGTDPEPTLSKDLVNKLTLPSDPVSFAPMLSSHATAVATVR